MTESEQKKKCTQCKETKPLRDFYVCYDFRSDMNRVKAECKRCNKRKRREAKLGRSGPSLVTENVLLKEYQRAYYRENKEKFKEYRANFRARNPDYFKNVYLKNKPKIQARNALLKAQKNDVDII